MAPPQTRRLTENALAGAPFSEPATTASSATAHLCPTHTRSGAVAVRDLPRPYATQTDLYDVGFADKSFAERVFLLSHSADCGGRSTLLPVITVREQLSPPPAAVYDAGSSTERLSPSCLVVQPATLRGARFDVRP